MFDDQAGQFFVSVEGVKLEARYWNGSGTPIMLLHEGLGSVALWRDFPELLSKVTGHPVFAWSRRGYGKSDPILVSRSAAFMHEEAKLLPALVDVLGFEKVILFGHSDGASIALLVASMFPELVEAIIVEAPHVYVEELTINSIKKVSIRYKTSDMSRRLGKYHIDPDTAFWSWCDIWLSPSFKHWNIEGYLPSIKTPTLLIQGLDDEYGTLNQLDRISSAVPFAQRVELEACKHSPHFDQAEIVLDVSKVFIGDLYL